MRRCAAKGAAGDGGTGCPAARRQAVELLPCAATRRCLHHRLCRPAHPAAVPQDGRREREPADQPAANRARGPGLAQPRRLSGRRAGEAVQLRAARARQEDRHSRPDLPEVAEQDPQRRHAAQAHRRPHRQAQLVGHRGRHQGRRLRGAVGARCGGREVRCGPVLHAPRSYPGHGRLRAATTGRHDHGSRVRHRRLPACRARVHPAPPRRPAHPRAAGAPTARSASPCAMPWRSSRSGMPR